MQYPLVVGLCGLAGAGKSTLAALTKQTMMGDPVTVEIVPFAAPIKEGLAVMGITKSARPAEYRKFAQLVGAGMRNVSDAWWVQQFIKRVWVPRSGPTIVLADDCRYENEAKICDLAIFISPSFSPHVGMTPSASAHESEAMGRAGFDLRVHTHEILNREGAPMEAATRIRGLILRQLKARQRALAEEAEPHSASH